MKTLLIQIRENPHVLDEEYQSFLKYSGLREDQLYRLNLFDQKLELSLLDQYEGIFVGGASAANVLEPQIYTFMPDLINLLKECINRSIPTFASCFGFQAAVLALDGKIIDDKSEYEMGTIDIHLTDNAKNDILFHDISSPFKAVSVHQQKAIHLPAGCEQLAQTSICLHSFKVIDKPFWAFQFHPEVDKRTLVERLAVYQKKYTDGQDHYLNVIESAAETPESNLLVRKFVERVLLK